MKSLPSVIGWLIVGRSPENSVPGDNAGVPGSLALPGNPMVARFCLALSQAEPGTSCGPGREPGTENDCS
jgi:hypothetical protein